LNVNRLTLTPLNAWDGAGVAGPADADDAADAGADAGGVVAAELLAGDALGDAGLHPAMTSIKPTTGAMDLNRDTGVLLLTTPEPSSILNDWR
jgi:hypothetical protein